MSVNYSKAFNRLEHLACLTSFARAGASNQLIKILTSFLQGRLMTVKVDKARSQLRRVNAGAPQGSVLGTYMFNVGTDDLEDGHASDYQTKTYQLNEGDLSFLELSPVEQQAHSTPERSGPAHQVDLSPVVCPYADVAFLPMARNIPPNLTNRIDPTWRPKPIKVNKFVDDNLSNEKVYMRDIDIVDTDTETFKNARAGQSESLFNFIAKNAHKKGLKINTEKTTLLAVSTSTGYRAKAHFYDDNNTRVDCANTLKALGFIFNQEANVSDQIDSLCKRFRSRTWALRDLRKAGLDEHDLIRVYKSTIRPVIEYSSVIYHSMLTKEQAEYIEKQQTRALKNIFGNQYSRRRLLELANLPTLEHRREQACLRFAQKTANNPRFQHHFVQKKTRLRANKASQYVEQNARTNRRKNSPYFYFRRILNEGVVRYE